MTFTVNQVLDI